MNDNQINNQRTDVGDQGLQSQNDQDTEQVTEQKKGKYTVEVIRDKCIGAASCVAVAPATFKLDDENIAVVLGQKLDSDENLLLAAQSCPTAAIIVKDDETGEQVWPK